MKTKTNHGGTKSPSMAGGTKAIPSPTKTPQRAVEASKRTSTGKAVTGGATFPSPYQGPAAGERMADRNVAGMSVDAGQALAPSDACPVRLRHRLGGQG